MVRTRDLFKRIRDTKGKFHAKIGTIKDRNGKGPKKTDLTLVPNRKRSTSRLSIVTLLI